MPHSKSAEDALATALRHRIDQKRRPLYMPYLTLGDPGFAMSVEIASAMIRGGADVLELGIPFSDPTADGPVIQRAMVRSMSQPDFSLDQIFETTAAIHRVDETLPIVYLTYLNLIVSGQPSARAGYDSHSIVESNARQFFERAKAAGVSGFVIPDLPFDAKEAELLHRIGADTGIVIATLIAPNTADSRLEKLAESAQGFIYYVTSQGVTGERTTLPADLSAKLHQVRSVSKVPVFAGFGISRPEQVKALVGHADGVIAGSVNHRIIEEDSSHAPALIEELTVNFIAALQSEE